MRNPLAPRRSLRLSRTSMTGTAHAAAAVLISCHGDEGGSRRRSSLRWYRFADLCTHSSKLKLSESVSNPSLRRRDSIACKSTRASSLALSTRCASRTPSLARSTTNPRSCSEVLAAVTVAGEGPLIAFSSGETATTKRGVLTGDTSADACGSNARATAHISAPAPRHLRHAINDSVSAPEQFVDS